MLAKLKAAKVRPADLARALEVDRSTASLMLSGKRGIPTWHLDAIAELIGVTVSDLFVESVARSSEGPSYAKKPSDVTLPGPEHGVQDVLLGQGGPPHADSTRDRLSKSKTAHDAEVWRRITEKLLTKISHRLEGNADDVRAAAAELRAVVDAAASRTETAVGSGGRKRLRAGATRRRRVG